MNPDYEKQLAEDIDRELKALPDLAAPSTLAARVMAAIAQRAASPWYRRAWQTWPVALQAGAVALLAILVGAACFGAWELTQGPALAGGWQKAQSALSPLFALLNALNALVGVVALAIKPLGSSIWLAAVAAIALAWGACVGLGTIYYRVAFARR